MSSVKRQLAMGMYMLSGFYYILIANKSSKAIQVTNISKNAENQTEKQEKQ